MLDGTSFARVHPQLAKLFFFLLRPFSVVVGANVEAIEISRSQFNCNFFLFFLFFWVVVL